MKVRLVRNGEDVVILCSDGTICNASIPLLAHFFTHFDQPNLFTGTDGRWDESHFDIALYPGETVACIADNGKLLVEDCWVLSKVISSKDTPSSKYISSTEFAAKHNRSREVVKAYLREGRIMGAIKVGRQWLVPEDAPYPVEEVSRKPYSGRVPYKN